MSLKKGLTTFCQYVESHSSYANGINKTLLLLCSTLKRSLHIEITFSNVLIKFLTHGIMEKLWASWKMCTTVWSQGKFLETGVKFSPSLFILPTNVSSWIYIAAGVGMWLSNEPPLCSWHCFIYNWLQTKCPSVSLLYVFHMWHEHALNVNQ